MTHPLASAQATLSAASKAAWDAVEADLRARPPIVHAPGARLLFVGFDPTTQVPHAAGRAIAIMHKDERFLVPLDAEHAHRVGHLRDLQTLFGWPVSRETSWCAVGEILASRVLEPLEGEEPAPGAPTREHDVRLREIYVPGEVLLVPAAPGRADEPRPDDATPGYAEALEAVDRLQGAAPSTAGLAPEELVKVLSQVLATHHWRAFDALCDDALGATDRRMAFEQFRQAWEAAAGVLVCESVEIQAGDGEVVRTRIRRAGSKPGEVLVRPLRWVRRGEGWRYLGGIL